MKVLTPQQLKHIDQQTISTQHISSLELMERASKAVVAAIQRDCAPIQDKQFSVVCGTGNNGGDGLAIARLLLHAGAAVKIYLLQSANYSEDNKANQELLSSAKIQLFSLEDELHFPEGHIIIDALLGYGLNRPLTEDWRNIITAINVCQHILSIDIPSGLLANHATPANSPVVEASKTYTFQTPKLAFFQPENAPFVAEFAILPIGLDEAAMASAECSDFYLASSYIKSLLQKRKKFSHKGTFGHALIIGGSYGKIGAVILSCKASLHSGCGLVSCYIPSCGYTAVQTRFPECMVHTDTHEKHLSTFPEIDHYNAIGIGIGLGQEADTIQAFTQFIRQLKGNEQLVLDADALNILAQFPELLHHLPANTILTPHPKELERLIGKWNNDFEKLEKVKIICKEYKIIVLIKGAHTCIVSPQGEVYYNSTGNPGMATAGSGDVLTGVITSLLAQSYPALQAAQLGVFIHGKSGDLALNHHSMESIIATTIIEHLGKAFTEIQYA